MKHATQPVMRGWGDSRHVETLTTGQVQQGNRRGLWDSGGLALNLVSLALAAVQEANANGPELNLPWLQSGLNSPFQRRRTANTRTSSERGQGKAGECFTVLLGRFSDLVLT